MDSKLTLKLDAEVIKRAKLYAKNSNISLSKLIENYLAALTTNKTTKRKVNPIIKSLTGVVDLDGSENYKKSHSKYLTEKYK